MKRIIFIDIGELGWSLLLSARMRWLKKNTDNLMGIMTFADRQCLYKGIADFIYNVPDDFHKRFDQSAASRFSLKGTSREELKNYFEKRIPPEYELVGYFGRGSRIKGKSLFKPYSYSKELNGQKEILVFPRFRNSRHIKKRNLSMEFYAKAIDILCTEFPLHIIRTMGITSGAYEINGIRKDNYVNDVRQDANLQDLIDRCQVAVAAVGSQSAPPKIALLQGVPTFMIGHQKARHVGSDNWMKTKVEFYEIQQNQYALIDEADCRKKLIDFMRECQ